MMTETTPRFLSSAVDKIRQGDVIGIRDSPRNIIGLYHDILF